MTASDQSSSLSRSGTGSGTGTGSESESESESTAAASVQLKKTAIIGIGYVGLVTGATFAKQGLDVICVDIIPEKIEMLNRGEVPFYEPALDSMVAELVQAGKLKGTTDLESAVKESAVSFICVGTPQGVTGFTDLGAVRATAQSIGKALRDNDHYHVVATKSTVPPGTGLEVILPILQESSGKKCGADFGLCSNPEFLREGSAIKDSLEPDRIVIGGYDKRSCEAVFALYDGFSCPILRFDIPTAETVKYAANAFLATKISFINELAKICEQAGVDVYKVKEV